MKSKTWRKSSYSGGGNNCVEVSTSPNAVGIRDTKDRKSGQLRVNASTWSAFLAAVK